MSPQLSKFGLVALKWKRNGEVTEWNSTFAYATLELGIGVELCWPYRPQEKGSVENLVGFVKSSFFKVRRFRDANGRFIADAIYEIDHPMSEPAVIVDLAGKPLHEIPNGTDFVDLLVPVFRRGEFIDRVPQIRESRQHARQQLGYLPGEVTRLNKPRPYEVGLEKSLHDLRLKLIAEAQRDPT